MESCLLQWGSDTMTKGVVPKEVTTAVATAADAAKMAQIMHFIKENQLLTALGLFCLWQTGAFLSAYSYVQGGMC